MQFRLYEFEIAPKEGMYIAIPFDFEGGTVGDGFQEACQMAADWLKGTIEDCEMTGIPLPEATFENKARYADGRIVLIGVAAGRETVARVSAAEAARRLGVTPARVSQMVKARQLTGWREGSRTWVALDSLEIMLHRARKAGRPKKYGGAAIESSETEGDAMARWWEDAGLHALQPPERVRA